MRLRHFSPRTESAYLGWMRRYYESHGRRDPSSLGAEHVTAFLNALATRRRVAASTQNQALAALLFLYKSRLIRVTENFRLGVVAATGGIALFYLVSFVLRLFGIRIPYIHDSGPIGIIFSLVVVTIAALNLVLDFDFIERGSSLGAPRYMEWYAAFGLMVTVVWLYLEILRLLGKLNSR